MNLREVHRVLNDMFQKELTNERQRHVVFWYDAEGEFVEDIDGIKLENVRIWKMTKDNLFATKYELEKNDPTTHFLLYATMAKPSPREDWLYSIYKLGDEFATDKITVNMRELGITDDALRPTFKEYERFFKSNVRFQAFAKFPIESYTKETIDITVLAVLTKSRTNTLEEITKALISQQLADNNGLLEQVKKFGSEDEFWLLMERYYGYTLPEKSLQSLTIFLMVTYVSHQNSAIELPHTWQQYISQRPTNGLVFMDQWMNHREDRDMYNELADIISSIISVSEYVDEWTPSNGIIAMDAFRIFDEKIIHYLVAQLTNDLTQFDMYFEMIFKRRKLHWYPEYEFEYEAIHQATQLMRLIHDMSQFIPEQSSYAMFQAYMEDYYVIDTAYRKFYVAYDQIVEKDRLHMLREKIENIYSNWYVEELAMKWVGSLERLEEKAWPVSGITQQMDFYRNWVHPYQANDERVFVIISDALRYEVAIELMNDLNNERKASTEIAAIQSVLPSYTALGMAALLPYKELTYTKEGSILNDGVSTAGTSNRNKIIQAVARDAMAIQFNDVIRMNQSVYRETFAGKKLIYIYHNTIDAYGDNPATEMDVFKAAEEAITNIRTLVNQLVNNVSASNIIITADHGFIYQRDPVTTSQKNPQYKENVLLTNRRFLLSEQKVDVEGTLSYPMDYIANQVEQLYVTVPKGANRFAVQGAGANYVHGGAMLQEIVVPVITFKNDRSKSTHNEAKKVDVKLTTQIRKITNTTTYLEFFQTSRIEDKVLPRNLTVYFVDEDGEHISNENRIIADSESPEVGQRAFRERFIFKDKFYEKEKTYYLVLEDANERDDHIYEQHAFSIDIAFMNK